ncbi:MAG: hypothetical protein M9935_08740 [Kiritimatiellae bacterium]|nr:hypothetical protein [Kiritimatiellia bacterium]
MRTQILVAGLMAMIFCRAISAADSGQNSVPSTNAAPGKSEPLTITTRKGTTYENCRLLRVEPDGISYAHSRGIAKLLFSELPPEFAKRYGYNPQAARDYSEAVQENQARFRQYQEDARQRDLEDRGARLEEIRANPKYTVVCVGGKAGGIGSVDATASSDSTSSRGASGSEWARISAKGARQGVWNLPPDEFREWQRKRDAADRSPGSAQSDYSRGGGGSWEAVVNIGGIPVVLGTASSYEGANSILHEKGYAGQGYIHRKR